MKSQLHFPTRKGKTLIIGLGNTLLSDDGIGIYIVRKLGKIIDNPYIVFKEAPIGGLELLDIIVDYKKVIIIDSLILENNPLGTLVQLSLKDLKGGSSWTRHQVSLNEAVELAKKIKMNVPDDIRIYGIVVKDISTFKEECTPEIKQAFNNIVENIKNVLKIT